MIINNNGNSYNIWYDKTYNLLWITPDHDRHGYPIESSPMVGMFKELENSREKQKKIKELLNQELQSADEIQNLIHQLRELHR